MKRSLFVVFCLATMVYAGSAYAYDTVTDCAATACNVQNTYTVVGQSATGCNRYYETCYECGENWKVYNCESCKSGYTHSTETLYITSKTSVTAGQCTKNTGVYCTATNDYGAGDYPQIKGCSRQKVQKFGGQLVSTCEECESGWFLREQEMSVDGCSNKYTYQTCSKDLIIPDDCDSSNCKDDLLWILPSAGANYMTKTNRSCWRGRCLETTVYSCTSGYYGTATATSQDCHACPDGGNSALGDNTEITKCYATSGKDATGDYKFESKCYYSGQ